MAERFAALLTSHGTMVWEGRNIKPHGWLYKCDLGFGGELFEVGSSVQIWGHTAPITTAMLNRANGHAPGTAGGATAKDVKGDAGGPARRVRVWAEQNYRNFQP